MRLYISNAFSLSMLDREEQKGTPCGYVPTSGDAINHVARVPRPLRDTAEAQDLLADFAAAGETIVGVVGHADTAAVVNQMLGINIPHSRAGIRLRPGDTLLVAQLVAKDGGPYRLPEGSTKLPEDATIEWWLV